MRASSLVRELWLLAIVNGAAGAGLVAAYFTVDNRRLSDAVYCAICVVAVVSVAYFARRRTLRALGTAQPAPEAIVVGRLSAPAQIELGVSLVCVLATVIAPYYGFFGFLYLATAIGELTSAAIVARWQQRHDRRLVRACSWADIKEQYLAH